MAETHAAVAARANRTKADALTAARKEVMNAELALAVARRRLAAIQADKPNTH